MKIKLLLVACLALVSVTCFSQTDNEAVNTSDWRLRFQISGPNVTGSFSAIKPLKKNFYLTLGFTPRFRTSREETVSDRNNGSSWSNEQQKSWGLEFALGTECHFNTKKKLDPYVGFAVGFGYGQERNKTDNVLEYFDADDPWEVAYEERIRILKLPPNYSINPNVQFGVNYFFTPRMALGVQYSIGASINLRRGLSVSDSYRMVRYGDGTTETSEEEYVNEAKSISSGLGQNVGLHFIYVIDKTRKKKTSKM